MLLGVNRQQDDRETREFLENHTCGVQSVEQRHRQIEHRHRWPHTAREMDRGPAVRRLTDDVIALAFENRAEPLPDDLVIVGEQQASRHCPPPAG